MNRIFPVLSSLLLGASVVSSPAQFAILSSGSPEEGRGFLGVQLQDVTPEIAKDRALKREQGAICAEIIPGTPAEDAGLKADDLITKWDGERVRSALQLKRLVGETPVGRTVRVGLLREGEDKLVKVTVGERDLAAASGMPFHGLEFDRRQMPMPSWHPPVDDPDLGLFSDMFPPERLRLGVKMQTLSGQLATYFGLEEDDAGVLVVSVQNDSAAEAAGLQAGDVITKVGGDPVRGPQDVQTRIMDSDGLVDITVLRERQVVKVQADLGHDDDHSHSDHDHEHGEDDLKEEISYPRGSM